MRIIHCADLHLDSDLGTNLIGDQKKERKAELLTTFIRMVDYAAENGVSAVLIAGDLFDKKNPTQRAKSTVIEQIRIHPDITFFYLQGNHDMGDFLPDGADTPENLKTFGDEWKTYELGNTVRVTGLELSEKNSQTCYASLALSADKVNIVMLHGQVGEYKAKDKAENINLSALRGHFIDYLALGHIHSYKSDKLDARGEYCYSGCLEGRGYDEAGPHGFVLLDIDEEKREVKPEFVDFAKRHIYVEDVDVTDCESETEVFERIEDMLLEKSIAPESMVKIVLVGSVYTSLDIDTELIRQRLADRFYHVKVSDETKLKVDYESFESELSLKGEFVRTVKASDLSEERKAEVIKMGIQLLRNEEVDICS